MSILFSLLLNGCINLYKFASFFFYYFTIFFWLSLCFLREYYVYDFKISMSGSVSLISSDCVSFVMTNTKWVVVCGNKKKRKRIESWNSITQTFISVHNLTFTYFSFYRTRFLQLAERFLSRLFFCLKYIYTRNFWDGPCRA